MVRDGGAQITCPDLLASSGINVREPLDIQWTEDLITICSNDKLRSTEESPRSSIPYSVTSCCMMYIYLILVEEGSAVSRGAFDIRVDPHIRYST